MQKYTSIPAGEDLKDSRGRLNDNFDTLKSNFSGASFPVINLSVGMTCYRTDLKKVFRLTGVNPDVWAEVEDLTKPFASQVYVEDKLKSYRKNDDGNFDVPVVAPSFAGEVVGNASTATKLSKQVNVVVEGNASGTSSVKFDGSGDIVVNVDEVSASAIVGTLSNDITGTAANATNAVNATNSVNANSATKLNTLNNTVSSFSGSVQPYRHIMGGFSANIVDAVGGSGDFTRDYLRIHTGIPTGTYSLQQILQELINRSRSVDVYRERYNCNCNCNCNCDCSDDSA